MCVGVHSLGKHCRQSLYLLQLYAVSVNWDCTDNCSGHPFGHRLLAPFFYDNKALAFCLIALGLLTL